MPVGPISVDDVVRLSPQRDEVVVIGISGERLLAALENGVSQVPKAEGRFPLISGIRFAYDAAAPPGQRVVASSVLVCGAPLDRDRVYRLATKKYLAGGKDGYDSFAGCPVLVDGENCSVLPVMLRNHFSALRAARKLRVASSGSMAKVVSQFSQSRLASMGGFGSIRPAVDGRIVGVSSEPAVSS
jgi:5'-nucleotidase